MILVKGRVSISTKFLIYGISAAPKGDQITHPTITTVNQEKAALKLKMCISESVLR